MTEELNVLDIPEEEVVQSKSQKQLAYETLEKESGLDKDHIWSFYEMDQLNNVNQRPVSTLPSIMLKYVLQYCMPIVTTEEKDYNISLQSETIIYAINKTRHIAIPVGRQYKVIGIRIPSIFLKHFNKYMLVHYEHVSDADIALSGRYGLLEHITGRFTQSRDSFTHPGLPKLSDTIMFTNDAQVIKILNVLLDYIEFIEKYYNVTYPILRYDLIKPDIVGSSYLAWKIINGVLVQQSHSQKSSQKSQKDDLVYIDFSTELLNVLNTVQKSKFGESFYYDILYMLDSNRLTKLYNLGLRIGIDNKSFKKELEKFKNAVDYDNEYLRQVNIGYKRQLEIIKRKSIAYEKFGIKDLTKLNKKQLDIINLELNKIDAVDKGGDANRQIWAKLRAGLLEQTSNTLKTAVKMAEKAFSNKQLNSMELLNGGVCPHVYHIATKTLDSFGRNIDLRDFLIEQYALPADNSGYFCKICGEQIALADTTSVMKFTGERNAYVEDDALQTMIWKEAMFIVNNNIRFTTPIPIKPLVNSLASGLRNQIASEESKLYRSKTNTGESIKDTLNLYAAIYIYAALCALMMANPGKLIFAREPPADWKAKRSNDGEVKNKNADDRPKDQEDSPKDQEDSQKITYANKKVAAGESEFIQFGSSKKVAAGKLHRKDKNEFIQFGSSKKHRKSCHKSGCKLGNKVGGKVVTDAKVAEKFYLMTALKLILLSKETIISRLKNMSIDFIKQIFIKNAYTWASKYAKPIQVDEETERQTKENPIKLDPFYKYVYLAKRLSGKRIEYDVVQDVLGKTEKEILKDIKDDISMYSHVKPPAEWSFGDKDYDHFTYMSFLEMLEYYNEKIYTKSFVPRHVQVTEYNDKYANLIDLQYKIRMKLAKKKIRPHLYVELERDLVTKYNKFDPHLLDLAQHYCPNGDQHKTGSYVYAVKNGTVELTKKDIATWLETNNTAELKKFATMQIINERCEKCKNLIRDAKSTAKSDKTFAVMFKKLDDLLAFYQYYETRCPKGNLHDIQNGICSICKFHTDFVKKLDHEYYDKYSTAFLKVQREKQMLSIRSLNALKKANIETHEESDEKTVFQFTLKKTAEWSQMSAVKYNMLVNIGLFEGIKFEQIESANINPSKNKEPSMTRAMRIKGHILNVLREYNLVLNHENIVDIPLPLKEMINAQKKIELVNLTKEMPKFDDFMEKDNKYKYQLNVSEYINFLIEYLAGIIVSIGSVKDKYSTIGKSLASYFTDMILSAEKFICKPEPYFAKLDISTLEDNSEDEVGISGDEWAGHQSEKTESEFEEEKEVETYENEIDNEGYDVENADDIWENE